MAEDRSIRKKGKFAGSIGAGVTPPTSPRSLRAIPGKPHPSKKASEIVKKEPSASSLIYSEFLAQGGSNVLTSYPSFAKNPQYRELIKLFAKAKSLTKYQHLSLCEICDAQKEPTRIKARDLAWTAIEASGRAQSWEEASEGILDSTGAWEAKAALIARDLIGQYGFTQEAYDLLGSSWRKIVGEKIHPVDVEPEAQVPNFGRSNPLPF